ncbi:MAG TPA: aryl-sulfate sulfotransferase [Chloroflexota bacterium]|nr:aryl-sulfate sulfotransferase [Chloroflexota bacterium]
MAAADGLSRRQFFVGLGAGIVVGGGGAAAAYQAAKGRPAAAPTPAGARPSSMTIEPNTIKRRGVGFRGYDPQRASPGFTLFAPAGGNDVHLIDIQGNETHTWHMPYAPGLYGYLTDKGTLFYLGKIPNDTFIGKSVFHGGAAMEADWNGKVLWEIKQPDQHHDGRLLKNGNVLLVCSTELPADIAKRVKGGLTGSEQPGGKINGDYLVEMTTDGKTVWEWRAWEHIEPEDYPILGPSDDRTEWTHANAVSELPDGNILLSFRNTSHVIRINRQTGSVEWRLGPPPLSGQHGITPLPNGNYLLFDNGPFRADVGVQPFSRILEINPDSKDIVWKYQDGTNPGSAHFFFSSRISNPQRLPNGNTLVNEGLYGRFFEVTPDGDVVWEYVNSYFGPANLPPKGQTNNVFRAYRYTADEIARAQKTG